MVTGLRKQFEEEICDQCDHYIGNESLCNSKLFEKESCYSQYLEKLTASNSEYAKLLQDCQNYICKGMPNMDYHNELMIRINKVLEKIAYSHRCTQLIGKEGMYEL